LANFCRILSMTCASGIHASCPFTQTVAIPFSAAYWVPVP
jgi:hypothetical protein